MVNVLRAAQLRRIELQRVTLDDVFVRLVGGSVAEVEAAGAADKAKVLHG
jgi:hypothetical protein